MKIPIKVLSFKLLEMVNAISRDFSYCVRELPVVGNEQNCSQKCFLMYDTNFTNVSKIAFLVTFLKIITFGRAFSCVWHDSSPHPKHDGLSGPVVVIFLSFLWRDSDLYFPYCVSLLNSVSGHSMDI